MKKIISRILLLALFVFTVNTINAQVVYMSTDKAPADCKFRGNIYGGHVIWNSKGGRNISELHIHQAKELGANYVEMNPDDVGGRAYSCPLSEISNLTTPYN